jgi:type II secretory pathway component PulK
VTDSRFKSREGKPGTCKGSILIYVLWILVVISVLAFQLTSASRVTTLGQSAFSSQLKKQMQLDSAIQFSIFKILTNKWQHKVYDLSLNGQAISVKIFNEQGFFSIYEVGDKSLEKIFEFAEVDETTVESLKKEIVGDKAPLRFNSFYELQQFSALSDEMLEKLMPLISIYHESPVNPNYSPVEVLMQFSRVDQYRVQKLMESVDEVEKV